MIKKTILVLITSICIAYAVSTTFFVSKKIVNDIQEVQACNGKIQLTCWENWCEELCYPLPTNDIPRWAISPIVQTLSSVNSETNVKEQDVLKQ